MTKPLNARRRDSSPRAKRRMRRYRATSMRRWKRTKRILWASSQVAHADRHELTSFTVSVLRSSQHRPTHSRTARLMSCCRKAPCRCWRVTAHWSHTRSAWRRCSTTTAPCRCWRATAHCSHTRSARRRCSMPVSLVFWSEVERWLAPVRQRRITKLFTLTSAFWL